MKRGSLLYRIDMFFYWLTWRDVKRALKLVGEILFDVLALILIFGFLFFFPAFFH